MYREVMALAVWDQGDKSRGTQREKQDETTAEMFHEEDPIRSVFYETLGKVFTMIPTRFSKEC
jgi:hypothetical protein